MRKIIALLLAGCMLFSLAACGGTSAQSPAENTEVAEAPATEDLTGVYKNITFSPDTTYQLNENTTYDKTAPDTKGTYEANESGGFDLAAANGYEEEAFAKQGDYYYRTNLICCFSEDEDYGLEPTFDENGRTEQWFTAYYDSISEDSWNVLILQLWQDGTFRLRDCIRTMSGNQSDGTLYEGTYRLEDDILHLDYEGGSMPFLLIDGKIYFDVLQKQA